MGVMVTNKAVVHGTDKYSRLMERASVTTALVSEDNVDRIMTDLKQSQKKVTQLKETLKKERNESHNLKRKYEDMISEIEVSKAECQTLQSDKDALFLPPKQSARLYNIEKESKAILADFGRL